MSAAPTQRRTTLGSGAIAVLVASSLLLTTRANADDVKVMTSGAFTAAYLELVPEFELAMQHKVETVFGASMGNASDSIPTRLKRGESADVVIMISTALDALAREGRIVPGSRVDLARSVIGMAVRAGARKPDITTVAALKRTLLEASSIAYSASASGTYLSTELFQRLGVAEQMKGKAKKIESERVGAVVARGEAEIGFQQVSELLPIPGIDYVGPLPAEVQQVSIVSAALVVGTRRAEAATALLRFLASPAAVPAITKTGLEPIAQPQRAERWAGPALRPVVETIATRSTGCSDPPRWSLRIRPSTPSR
jgi:molybdate transport system substrate-binding protein